MEKKDTRILLIGFDGQLGSDLKKSLAEYDLLFPSTNELDVTDFSRVKEYLLANGPRIVINTAAFHQVDDCERDLQKTFLVNAYAVRNLAHVCGQIDATLVHISTDYVFGGDKARRDPYREDDIPVPVNAYGISKLAGEHFIKNILDKYFIVRPAALFGVAGAKGKGGNFVETMIKLGRQNGSVKVKDDEFTSPTSTKDLAGQIAALIESCDYGTYHATGEGQCSWHEFAKKIFELADIQAECLPVASAEVPTFAARPRYSVLDNANLKKIGLNKMRRWEDALLEYLEEKGYVSEKINKKNMAENQKTKIDGLEISNLKVNFDDRGYLFEVIHNYEIPKFGQVYVVGDPVRGSVRAFHKHDLLWDYFCIVKGSAKFVFSDDRPQSRTYKKLETVVISERAPKTIIVPPGVYHGWMSLEDDTVMVSTGSELYNREKPDEYRISPDTFGDVWTIKGK